MNLDLRAELALRDLSVPELAEAAHIDPQTAYRIAQGKSAGLPRTRRAIRRALAEFPIVDGFVPEPEPAPAPVAPQTPADAPVVPQRKSGAELLAEHMKSARDPFAAQPTN